MVVRTQCEGRKVTGLYIGARNVRRNFPRQIAAIEVELGHLHIRCELKPVFWRGQPEIRDPRLCAWLESRLYHQRPCRTPLPLALITSGKNAFKLKPFGLPSIASVGAGSDRFASLPMRQPEDRPLCGAGPCKVRRFIA